MRYEKWFYALIIAGVLALSGAAFAVEYVGIVREFVNARTLNDEKEMNAIIERNKDKIPGEVKALVEKATMPGATEEDKRGNFYIAEIMATIYRDMFGDVEPMKALKKAYFDDLLGKPVRSVPLGGVHKIEVPPSSGEGETAKYTFSPDNIIVKKGDTVRWVNNDTAAHIFASMPMIGEKGMFSPTVEPGQSWEYKFERPGEYYYLCFIHRMMIGKVIVEDTAMEGVKAPAAEPPKEPAKDPVKEPAPPAAPASQPATPAKEPVKEPAKN